MYIHLFPTVGTSPTVLDAAGAVKGSNGIWTVSDPKTVQSLLAAGWTLYSPTGQMLRVVLAFATSPYNAVLNKNQITFFRVSSGSGADFVFNLPPATGSGDIAVIKKMDANAHNIAITPNPDTADTIDRVNAAVNITLQDDVLRIVDSAVGEWSKW